MTKKSPFIPLKPEYELPGGNYYIGDILELMATLKETSVEYETLEAIWVGLAIKPFRSGIYFDAAHDLLFYLGKAKAGDGVYAAYEWVKGASLRPGVYAAYDFGKSNHPRPIVDAAYEWVRNHHAANKGHGRHGLKMQKCGTVSLENGSVIAFPTPRKSAFVNSTIPASIKQNIRNFRKKSVKCGTTPSGDAILFNEFFIPTSKTQKKV